MTRLGWLILTRRYGGDERDPSVDLLATAVRELFVEDLPGMTEADYAEHGAASLRCGFDEGPMFVLELDRLRTARFEEWADQGFEHELVPARTGALKSQDEALHLFGLLASGDLEALRRWHWSVNA